MSAHELKFCSNFVCPGVNAAALTVWRGDDSREAMNAIDVLLGSASPGAYAGAEYDYSSKVLHAETVSFLSFYSSHRVVSSSSHRPAYYHASIHTKPVVLHPLPTPPAGKTWTISFAVRVLLARGASVLITSYTHSAVDNLLLKLIKEGVPCLRVGKPSSVHPGVRECCINHDGSAKTTAAYSELVASAR